MNRETARRPRPELSVIEDCACGQPRCTLTGRCLETALTDDRFGVWVRARTRPLRLAS